MKAGSALRTQEEAPRCPYKDGKKTLWVALLVFVSCNLLLSLTKAHRHLTLQKPSPAAASHSGVRPQVEPVGFLLSRASTVAMAYLSAAACGGNGRTVEEISSRVRRTWKRPAATLLCVEILATASSSLFWTLSALTRATRGAAAETLFISASAALVMWLGPVLFAHSNIACKLSLVVSIEEEECKGMAALWRAGELVEGRRLQGFVLAMLLAQLEQVPSVVLRLGRRGGSRGGWKGKALADAVVGNFMVASIDLIIKFLSYLTYTKLYHECKKQRGKG